ncbi:MAG: hypothetical protein MUO77_02200, partial [Anaerolineales bacterium]|nr:hypothetical protein [Anaerolineales bacterium]
MNNFSGIIKNSKTEIQKNIRYPNLQKLSTRQIIFWCLTLTLSVGVFFLVRSLVICWQLTPLPGIPPAYCSGRLGNPPGIPD